MINFKCLDWTEMLDSLEWNNGTCDLAPSGLAPMLDRMERGMQFSDPTLQSGLSVMMASQESMSSRSIWYFFSAMTWQVWVLLLITGFVAGFVVWLMEVGSKSLTGETRYLSSVVWDTVGRPVQMRDFRIGSIAGNTVGWVWSFTAFIVMSLYNAALTANMTIEQLNGLPRRISDLAGMRVGSWSDYNDTLLEYGIKIIEFPWESTDDEQRMLDALVSGQIEALVLDETALRILDANNCSTMIIEGIQPVQIQGQTAAFPKEAPASTINEYNKALRSLMENDQLTSLRSEFIFVEGAPCKTSAVQSDFTKVTWSDVAGLWVILGISVALALLVVASFRLWTHWLSKVRYFRRTNSISAGVSRSLTKLADNNMSGHLSVDEDYVFGRSGSGGGGDGVRDLVLAMQKELSEMKKLMMEQQRMGLA